MEIYVYKTDNMHYVATFHGLDEETFESCAAEDFSPADRYAWTYSIDGLITGNDSMYAGEITT